MWLQWFDGGRGRRLDQKIALNPGANGNGNERLGPTGFPVLII